MGSSNKLGHRAMIHGMSEKRYIELMGNKDIILTLDEVEDGWHFCKEWDFLLIHPLDPEYEVCICLKSGGV